MIKESLVRYLLDTDDSGEPRGIFKFNPQDIKVARKGIRPNH